MILIVDNGSIHTAKLRKFLKKKGVNFQVATRKSRLETIFKHRYKGVILSGGPLLYDKKINIENVTINFALLLDLNVPVLGICFGHQSIVESFDGHIRKLPKRIHGEEMITIKKRTRLFTGLPRVFPSYQAYIDCACKAPFNFEVTARSPSCSIAAMKHKKKPIYTTQFHPEASGEIGEKILENFLRICRLNHHRE